MAGIGKYTAQHTLTLDLRMSNGERFLNSIECLKLLIKRILHIKEMVCCFVLDSSPRSHACVVEKASSLIMKT